MWTAWPDVRGCPRRDPSMLRCVSRAQAFLCSPGGRRWRPPHFHPFPRPPPETQQAPLTQHIPGPSPCPTPPPPLAPEGIAKQAAALRSPGPATVRLVQSRNPNQGNLPGLASQTDPAEVPRRPRAALRWQGRGGPSKARSAAWGRCCLAPVFGDVC